MNKIVTSSSRMVKYRNRPKRKWEKKERKRTATTVWFPVATELQRIATLKEGMIGCLSKMAVCEFSGM